jgi:hypothetical protein
MSYDTLIVGGGIAGLYCARELLKHNPTMKVAVCEKYKKLGGRAATFKKEGLQWEMGAGRIKNSHTMLLGLIKEYGLHTIPIGGGLQFRETGSSEYEENHFEPAIDLIIKPLALLPASELGQHTLKELLVKIHGSAQTQKWMDRFPYHSEIVTMRADMAIREFLEEMKSHEGYSVCKEGLSALIDAMVTDIESRGGQILPQHELVGLGDGWANFKVGSWTQGASRLGVRLDCKRLILALHANALRGLTVFKGWGALDKVAMEPLLRIYASFSEPWLRGMTRVVTTSPIRYFIPVGDRVGMISYTDAKFARHYMGILDSVGEGGLEKVVMRDLRALFPEIKIPDPDVFKTHSWPEGVSYWLPGTYDPETVCKEALHPFPSRYPSLYVCGESFSLRQGWVEGALENAAELLDLIETNR